MIHTKKSVKTIRTHTVEASGDDFTVATDNLSTQQMFPVSPEEPTPEQWMRLAETSPGLDFWNRPEEDVYSDKDGEPV